MSDLFKWEDGGGLKHHCPICQTPLSHDKCRTQCLGVHVEWCGRYHTLFRKNWSSRCSACKTTDEQHEKRHREIAELIAKINKLKADKDEVGMEPSTPRTPLTARALNTVDGAITPDNTTPRTTKKERKKLKKAAKAMERDKVVTAADILVVANTLHPECEQDNDESATNETDLAENLDIRMNLKYNNSTCNTKTARHDFIKKDRVRNLEESQADVNHLMATFEMNTKAAGKEAKLVSELAAAIQKDLTHYHDELQTTAKLRSAFWRWANVKAYRQLVDNGKDWDVHSPNKERSDSIEDLRAPDEAAAMESDEEEKLNRNGSVDSSVEAASASTSITAPSTEPSPTKKPKSKTLTIALPPKTKEPISDGGWKQVGTKLLKPRPAGKLKMVKNGGLHHLAQTPKGSFGALAEAWSGPVDED